MTKTLTTPLMDLLCGAPESMVWVVQDAIRALADRDYWKAQRLMRYAGEAYEGAWHEKAAVAADELRAIAVARE